MIFTDCRTPEAKQWSKPLRKDGDEGVIGGFLRKEVHNVCLRLGVGGMKRGWEEVIQAEKSICAPPLPRWQVCGIDHGRRRNKKWSWRNRQGLVTEDLVKQTNKHGFIFIEGQEGIEVCQVSRCSDVSCRRAIPPLCTHSGSGGGLKQKH